MKHEIIIKTKISEINKVADFIAEIGKKYQVDDQFVFDVSVALDEVINNIISYGCNGNPDFDIKIEFLFKKKLLCVIVSDEGKLFNPLKIENPDLSKSIEDKPIGGLGFFLVKKLMDSVEYKSEENKNILFLYKKM